MLPLLVTMFVIRIKKQQGTVDALQLVSDTDICVCVWGVYVYEIIRWIVEK